MQYYVIDAFATAPFTGNPAGVCLLDRALSSDVMQKIASQNNLSETAFVWPDEDGYSLKWFTPALEMDLCGHATLAAAFALFTHAGERREELRFHTLSGPLTVRREGERFDLDFPARPCEEISMDEHIARFVQEETEGIYLGRDLVIRLRDENRVRNFVPDFAAMQALPYGFGIIITARGEEADFVSRCFYPKAGVGEDPVTGSAHCHLIPLWAPVLGKREMTARQLSARGGVLYCQDCGERVRIGGGARTYLKGEIFV